MHTASNRFCFVAQPGPRENITQLAHSWEKLPRYKAFAAILQVITCHENSKQLDGKSKERTASVTVFLLESQFLRQKRAKTLALMHAVYSLEICGDLLIGDSTECSTKIGIGFSPFALALLERTVQRIKSLQRGMLDSQAQCINPSPTEMRSQMDL